MVVVVDRFSSFDEMDGAVDDGTWDSGFEIVAVGVGVGVIGMGLDDWDVVGVGLDGLMYNGQFIFPPQFTIPVPITTTFHFSSLLTLTPLQSPLSLSTLQGSKTQRIVEI